MRYEYKKRKKKKKKRGRKKKRKENRLLINFCLVGFNGLRVFAHPRCARGIITERWEGTGEGTGEETGEGTGEGAAERVLVCCY